MNWNNKFLIYTDNHFCQNSSIVRKQGSKYSMRLENQIECLNWVEQFACEQGCCGTICLGDFFNATNLNAMEISALKEINWNKDLTHTFLVGNHEASTSSLEYNVVNLFSHIPNAQIIDTIKKEEFDAFNLYWLPYDVNSTDHSISNIVQKDSVKPNIVFSHNDLLGIQMGQFLSKTGYDIEEIDDCCALFINGHLHNGGQITSHIINLGSLTGQNFSEDAFKYAHNVAIIDFDKFEFSYFENPYALNFYKLNNVEQLPQVKHNAVVTLKVKDNEVEQAKQLIEQHYKNILEYKILIDNESEECVEVEQAELTKLDHLQQFQQFIHNTYGTTDILEEELSIIINNASEVSI